jgi:hypothetical protein
MPTTQRHLLLIAAFLAAILTGCIADEVGGIYMVSERVDTLHAVADQKADILFNAGGMWTAKASDSWLEVSPETGNGGRNIITVRSKDQNLTKQPRKTQVTITSDGKSKIIQVVQRGDFALFDSHEYVVDPAGGEVNMTFTTNISKGELYVSYLKLEWISIEDAEEKTRAEEWGGKIKPITVTPNEASEDRAAKFILGIYDERKIFMALDSTWIRQKGLSAP